MHKPQAYLGGLVPAPFRIENNFNEKEKLIIR